MSGISIVGGGIAGLVAGITCAEAEVEATIFEGHDDLGGRARSADGPYRANLGPHVLDKDGSFCRWLRDRDLMPGDRGGAGDDPVPLGGRAAADAAAGDRTAVLRLRGRQAPATATSAAGRPTTPTPGPRRSSPRRPGSTPSTTTPESSRPVHLGRTVRALLNAPPPARYVIGGWSALVEPLERPRPLARRPDRDRPLRHRRCRESPVIVATELSQARELLGDDSLRWPSGTTVCLDLGVEHRRGDPFVVSDLDEAGWLERYTRPTRPRARTARS